MSRAALLAALGASALLAQRPSAADESTLQLIDAPGRDLTATSCVICHSLDYIPMNAPLMSRAAWEKTIRKMIDKFGAPINQGDADQILNYLTTHYSG